MSSSLWAVPWPDAMNFECIVMIRKSVLKLECNQKLAYVMNTFLRNIQSHLFPVWDGKSIFYQYPRELASSLPKYRLTKLTTKDFPHNAITLPKKHP